jgi:predicted nucleic acid-binding protein
VERVPEKALRGSGALRILVDTTYFLPTISVTIKDLPNDLLRTLLQNEDYQLFYCEITLFELAAKGAKLILSEDSLTVEDITKGIDSIRWDKRLSNLPWYSYPLIMELATEIRKFHLDFIDCLILATAVCYTDVFAIFDETLFEKVCKNKTITGKILELNGKFSFWFSDLSKDPIRMNNL